MQRIQYHRYGGPEVMRLEDFERRPPGPGELRIRIEAAAVNPVDWKIRSGVMKFMTGFRFPKAMGLDFAGVVEATGAGVFRLRPGDEVLGSAAIKSGGAFSPFLVVEEERAVAKPASVSFEQAACLPVPASTAWNGLVDKARLQPGQTVFVNGCSGAVGRAAVQIASAGGARVAGSCSAVSMPQASQMGVAPVIDYAKMELAPLRAGFDVVFDTAGTLSFHQAWSLLTSTGVFVDINPTPAKFLQGLVRRRYRLFFADPTVRTLSHVIELAAQGLLTSAIGAVVPLADAIAAIARLEGTGWPKGKIVIVPGIVEV